MRDSPNTKEGMGRLPEATVIVPVWNRVDIVGRCLDALEKQETSTASFEVVVVDDGSDDSTGELLEKYVERGSRNLRVIRHSKHANAAAARNTGLKNAQAPIVIFLDADVVAKPNVIETHVNYHRRYPDNNVVILGNVKFPDEWPRTVLDELSNVANMWRNLNPHSELPWWNFFSTHISGKKSFLLSTGGFDERLSRFEDVHLGRRLMPMGLKIIYASEAVAYHYHRRTLKEFVTNERIYAKTLAQLYKLGDPLSEAFDAKCVITDTRLKPLMKDAIAALLANRMVFPATLWTANVLMHRVSGISALLCRVLCYHTCRTAFKREVKRLESDG